MTVRGFTLIELLVTLAILALLGTVVAPAAQVTVQRRHEQELRRSLREIRAAIDAYKKASDEGRIAKTAGATGYPPKLEVLVDGVPDLRSPKHAKIFFLRRLPRDPFNRRPGPGRSADLGQAQLRQRGDRSARRRRCVRRVFDLGAAGPERRAVPQMVTAMHTSGAPASP